MHSFVAIVYGGHDNLELLILDKQVAHHLMRSTKNDVAITEQVIGVLCPESHICRSTFTHSPLKIIVILPRF